MKDPGVIMRLWAIEEPGSEDGDMSDGEAKVLKGPRSGDGALSDGGAKNVEGIRW